MKTDDELESLYQETFEDAIELMEDYPAQAVAATYMAIALRLYKTHLDEEGFLKMIRTIMETEVTPYDSKKVLH